MNKTLFSNISFGLNCLLLFLLFAGKSLAVPAWVQIIGRMHPLVLHFPIVLLFIAAIWEGFVLKNNREDLFKIKAGDNILVATAFTSALVALMGLLLSQEKGYNADSLSLHKWTGVAVSVIAFLWYSFRNILRHSTLLTSLAMIPGIVAVIVAGHYGGEITHGKNYLLEPVTPEPQKVEVPVEQAIVFANVVQPILEKKCMSCHNSTKAKGELVMESAESLLKGGKNGKLWDLGLPGLGLLMDRIHLPLDDKKHMPPTGKPQLTEEETAILLHWIKGGSDFNIKLTDLDPKDTLRILAEKRLNSNIADQYTFKAAEESIIQKLNTNYRIIQPIALNSPALSVAFYGASAFNSQQLKELEPLKEQIVSLHLNKMPVKDEDLKVIASFINLRQLNLSFTSISGAMLGELKTLKWLHSLALSGTNIKPSELGFLKSMPKLTSLYLWNTSITAEDLEKAKKTYPDIQFEKGYIGDTVVAKLSMPIFKDEEMQLFQKEAKIELKHYVKGAELRYTLDGSDPDSIKSLIYKDGVLINKSLVFKAKAFLSDWISSDILTKQFYIAGLKPDSSRLVRDPNPQYTGKSTVLFDGKKGDFNFKSGKWLGFKETNFESFLYFDTLTNISGVTFSTLVDIGGYIMPPLQLEVWGGSSPANLKLLKTLKPQQPSKIEPSYLKGFACEFKTQKVKVMKLVGRPFGKLPPWHPGKGDLGWLFVDEIFIN